MPNAAKMDVELINYTKDAEDILIFTKQTRLTLSPGLLNEIKNWPIEKKIEELKYMANTIPSSWEFCDYTFLITGVSRAFTHQFVRTRTGSYAQQTMRILDVGEYDYVYTSEDEYYRSMVDATNGIIQGSYAKMVAGGIPIEDARGILPTNIATNIVAKFTLRTLSELCKSRTGGRTQSEYQKVANKMADEVIKVHPWTEMFLFQAGRDHYNDLESFAAAKLSGTDKAELLKIVDKMRKAQQ